ncbi:MAG: hypothetical protein H7317_09285, partial [Pseudorhodobacter sp.]|nr:hypothetical protein [Pseudorhodobacter sp.]
KSADAPIVTCIGGRWQIDDITAIMLTQLLQIEGATAQALSFADLAPSRFAKTEAALQGCVILCFLDSNPSRASLLHIRRIKRLAPQTRVGVVIWELSRSLDAAESILPHRQEIQPAKIEEALAIGADFVATTFEGALEEAFAVKAATALPAENPRPAPRRRIPPVALDHVNTGRAAS